MNETPMSKPVSHMEMCRALHNLHRATLNGTWCFSPLAVSLDKSDNEVVYVAYLEERLYIFRKGNQYRMAYGSNPHEAYFKAFGTDKVKVRTVRHHWHVSSYSPECGWMCEYDGKDAKEAKSAYLRAKRLYQRASVERDGTEYWRWE